MESLSVYLGLVFMSNYYNLNTFSFMIHKPTNMTNEYLHRLVKLINIH